MEAEKYVSEITQKIKCTRAKKLEIQKQLLSDISMRREAGESLEQIMESMGTAGEIADAFAQNLTEADKKAYKKRKILIIFSAIALALLLLCLYVWWAIPKQVDISGSEKYSQERIASEVEKVIELLDQNDYTAIQMLAADKLRNIMNEQVIGPAKDGICADWGERLAVGNVYSGGVKQKGNLIIVTQTDVIYENVSVVYTISFDEDMKLSGLYIR